jgi:ABC-type transporter Mla maintaining outer membrane lipid asymmetry ATPase subunit MlaF
MNASAENIIEVTDLGRKFGDRAVLDDISFNVQRGDTLVIMGGVVAARSEMRSST